ncbi:MAG TPA: Ig-like domain-containing protein [Microbacterium sp.]|uniref:Ig-like domain-containing protein n=1 Tax=Microbacterium sp. TaxID=51671 RepID=UPI002D020D13|nr:Ig-like domain-containing protein [Microbacterium sp.]HWI31946.1 Ig-like domain-containing protein [Microbacterium sp.]
MVRRRRRTLVAALAGVAAIASVIAISAVWPGLDAQRTTPVDTSVWALQTAEGRRYARVNTAIDELDTVRSVSNPTAIAQTDDGAFLFSESYGRLTRIDEAMPVDLDEDAPRGSTDPPAGTVSVAVAGDFAGYLTDTGAVWVGRLSGGSAAVQLNPNANAGDDAPQYTAEAIAVAPDGTLFSYSSADGAVLRYRIPDAQIEARDELEGGPTGAGIEIGAAGDRWVVIDTANGSVWRAGAREPTSLASSGAMAVARPTVAGDEVYIADEAGLIQVPLADAAISRTVGGEGQDYGQPARPVVVDRDVYAAWLRDDGGVMWRQGAGETTLDYGGQELPDARRPVFTVSGSTVILNETRSGWVWSMPDGALVSSSQDWSLDDNKAAETEPSDVQAEVVIDPKPPVAEADAFGVRAGSLVTLPVLLNDHDPNEDVLSIDPASVTGLPPDFGTVTITDGGGRLAVQVAAGAAGAATLQYVVSDGTSSDGQLSQPATVTLDVVPEDRNSAPEWCGTSGCLAEWPSPGVAPGGTVTVPVLTGWVDPEGDPVMLLAVENESNSGAVASTPSGEVVYQHPDGTGTGPETVDLTVTVADTRGAVTTRPLQVRVSPTPTVTAESFTVIDTLGGALSVDVAPHVTGTAGSLTLKSVRVLDDAAVEAVAGATGTAFDFSATDAGTYRVSYTVSDGTSEATATARITLLPTDAPAQLATAPVIAFVHPREDATIDLFAAVANPTRRVLLLSEVETAPAAGASLQVDAIGQNYLRVAGTTATGAAGILGTVQYRVSDGTDDAGSSVAGQATVYLLPPAPELAPIAVDDTVVVRAGAQVDIPVLENDVAPSGSAISLDPSTVTTTAPDALAFGSGGVLRYLAPTETGPTEIEYSIYSSGSPGLADTATVRVTVVSDESNRAPRPETLEGRVLSGGSTTIPFDGFGVDPDGDAVRLDRITSQPERGSATISADGDGIVYTSTQGDRGQESFEFRVIDGTGATGVGTVRIGVLGGEANPSPVTFTDYVYVQAGAGNSVRVSPLANDIDPTGGALALTDVRPDAVDVLEDGSPNPQYGQLESRLGDFSGSTIEIEAGTAPGTTAYLYDVVSESGNTGRGLIVVKVVRESVPDYPIVADTLLTAETRDRFARGVDVVSGKVSWTGGDVGELTMSVWGEPPGVTADGRELQGAVSDDARIIPFQVTGVGSAGQDVTSYAFLRIPGVDDVALALRAGLTPRQVTEGESVTFDLAGLVPVPRGRTLEVGDDVASSGARDAAVCAPVSGTQVRYDAGLGSPWTDACTVPVRVDGQEEWTYLSVPIRIRALDPQPELRPASVTVGPGETAAFALSDMTTWQRDVADTDIAYSIEFASSAFQTRLEGGVLTITADDRAAPGTEQAAIIGVTSHTGVQPARLTLRVGPAPSVLPQGGTIAQQCSQAAGSSCEITVIGAPGEVNPLPRTPLELTAVRATGACVGVSFQVASAASVLATWAGDAPGATCTASFSVKDAQGRGTNAERDGSLLLDLQGYPRGPASLRQTQYGDGVVTLRVDPGEARQAYPALTGFVIRHEGSIVATCNASGVCPDIAAPNGEERRYTAVAVNAIGESAASATTTAWAYDAPAAPREVSATPVVTGGEGGLVSVRVVGVETATTGFLELSSPTGELLRVRVDSNDTVVIPRYRIGANTLTPLTVTPISRFAVPPGLEGTSSGAAVTIQTNGIGAPVNPTLTLTSVSNGDGTSTVTASGTASSGGDGSETRYGITQSPGVCTVSPGGESATIRVPRDGEVYTFQLCTESWWQGDRYGRSTVQADVRAAQNSAPPTGFTFVVDASPTVSATDARWMIRRTPESPETPPRYNTAEFEGGPTTSVYDRDPEMRVRYVHPQWGPTTDWARVTPAAGSAPYQVRASWQVTSCTAGQPLAGGGQSSLAPSGGQATFTFAYGRARFYDAAGQQLPYDPATGIVPPGAVRVEAVDVTVDWSVYGWGLAPAATEFGGDCTPDPPATGGTP